MILLDTHVFLWWIGDKERLTRKAKRVLKEAETHKDLAVSAISFWEIALLLKKGRLSVTLDAEKWLDHLESYPGLHIIPVDATIARFSVFLAGPLHADPADRIIIATARNLNLSLITADAKIRKYPHVTTIW